MQLFLSAKIDAFVFPFWYNSLKEFRVFTFSVINNNNLIIYIAHAD